MARDPKPRIPRYLKEDEKGLYVVDNYGNVQRPYWNKLEAAFGYKQCKAKAGDKLFFRFSHCGYSSQGYASDGSHWLSC